MYSLRKKFMKNHHFNLNGYIYYMSEIGWYYDEKESVKNRFYTFYDDYGNYVQFGSMFNLKKFIAKNYKNLIGYIPEM